MSDVKLVLNNNINLSHTYSNLVEASGTYANFYEIIPDGFSAGASSIQFQNIVVPNLSTTVVSRNMRLRYQLNVVYNQNAINAPLFNGANGSETFPVYNPAAPVNTAPRAVFPLQSCVDVTQLTINGQTVTLNSRICIDALERRVPKHFLDHSLSEAPAMLDNKTKLVSDNAVYGNATLPIGAYVAWANVVAAGAINIVINGITCTYTPSGANPPAVGSVVALVAPAGFSASCDVTTLWVAAGIPTLGNCFLVDINAAVSGQPLSKYENSQGGYTRGGFFPSSYNGTAAATTGITFDLSESLFISPLTLHDNETFLGNINTLSLQLNWSSLNDILCSSVPIGGIVSLTISNPRLQLQYVQVSPDMVKIPAVIKYNYENVVFFQKTQTAMPVNALTTAQVTSDTVRFQTMPSLIYIAARKNVNERNGQNTDTQCFFNIGNLPSAQSGSAAGVQCNIGNRTGLFNSASPQTLWKMSCKNGLNMSYEEWQQVGGLLIINPVNDFGLDPNLDAFPGEGSASTNFQVTMQINNSNYISAGQTNGGQPVPVELMIWAVYSGSASISTDSMVTNLGELSHSEVMTLLMSAPKKPEEGQMLSSEEVTPSINGAGLFSPKAIFGHIASAIQSPLGKLALEHGKKFLEKKISGKGLRGGYMSAA